MSEIDCVLKQGNETYYVVDKKMLEDMGEEEIKCNSATMLLDEMIDFYPDKELDIDKICNDVNKLVTNSPFDYESKLMSQGIDIILRKLRDAFDDDTVFEEE